MKLNGSALKPVYREILDRGGNMATMLQGAAAAFILNVIGHGLAFLVQVLLARKLGVEQFGDYIYAITWVNILILVANMGVETSSLRFVAAYHSKQQWSNLHGFIRWGKLFPFMISLIVSFLLIVVILSFKNLIRNHLVEAFIIAAILLPIFSLSQIVSSMIRGFKIIVRAQGPLLIIRPLLFVLCILALSKFMSLHLTAAYAMGINVLCTLITLLLLLKILGSVFPQASLSTSPSKENRKWFLTSLSLVTVSASFLINKQTDILMIGFFLGTAEAGIYSAASRLSYFISFGLLTMNTITAPIIAELYAQKQMGELERLVKMATWLIVLFAVLLGLAMINWGKEILGLYGKDFIQSYGCMLILVIGQVVNSFTGPVGLLMTMTSYQNEAALIIGCSAALNIIMNCIFIPLFGIQGAAIATVITAILWNLALLTRVAKHLSINPSIFPLRNPFWR